MRLCRLGPPSNGASRAESTPVDLWGSRSRDACVSALGPALFWSVLAAARSIKKALCPVSITKKLPIGRSQLHI